MPGGNGRGLRWTNGSGTGRGRNRGFGRGVGNRIRQGFFQRRMPESEPPHTVQSYSSPIFQQSLPKEQELDLLKRQTTTLQRQINSILNRIDELNKKPQKGPERESSVKAYVIAEKCTSCGICMDVCEQGAITIDDVAQINGEKCTGCGSCVNICPNEALIAR
jgi:ferredoxin